MPRSNSRSHKDSSDWGVMEMARERPIAAAAAAAGAAVAGLFLWSKRNQISHQINSLSDQIGEWTDSMTSRSDDIATPTTRRAGTRSGAASRSASGTSGKRERRSPAGRSRGTKPTSAGTLHSSPTANQSGGNS